MEPVLIVVAVIAALVVAALVWHLAQRSVRGGPQRNAASRFSKVRALRAYPSQGVLVGQDVLQVVTKSSEVTVWEALEQAAVPIAVQYRPVSEAEVTKFRTVPINASVQRSMVEIVKALNPAQPTLYTVVLPKGAELVKAVGISGFRGFVRDSAGITAHAVLKPVAASGAIAAGWPIFAVAGTVMAIDMAAQRELRAHQRKVEAILGRQEERHYSERIKDQRSADAQLSRAISLILDGHSPNLELALKSAYDEFHRSQQFLEASRNVVEQLVDDKGYVDYRKLEEALGGKTKDSDYFARELHLARGAIAIRRKALLADAAGAALLDPHNPYKALRKFLNVQVRQLEEADRLAESITRQLAEVKLKGGWWDSDMFLRERQENVRALAASPIGVDDIELRFLSTSAGGIVQVIPADDETQSAQLANQT